MSDWTFGAEFEVSDWDTRRPHPTFFWGIDRDDVTMVNSNGVAVDPDGKTYPYGGEWLASPSSDAGGVASQMAQFMALYPESAVNYRSNLHVHIRVPGLRDDLAALKRVLAYCQLHLPTLLSVIESIPEPLRTDYPGADEWAGARRRHARRKVSHHRVMGVAVAARAMAATTTTSFFEAEALHEPTGRLLWAIRPRCAVNLRQLLQTDTVEFRHFPGTLDPAEVASAVQWCGAFLRLALGDCEHPVDLLWQDRFRHLPWPRFAPYIHWMEVRYLATSAYHAGRTEAEAEIARLRSTGAIE